MMQQDIDSYLSAIQDIVETAMAGFPKRDDGGATTWCSETEKDEFLSVLIPLIVRFNHKQDRRAVQGRNERQVDPAFEADGPLYNFFWKAEPTFMLYAAISQYRVITFDTFLDDFVGPLRKATEGGCFR